MIHTKEQIIEKAIHIMNQIEWGYNSEGIRANFNPKQEEIDRANKYIKDSQLINKVIENTKPDHWTVGFDFEPEAEIEYNRMFMDLWDETGEPFSVRHKQAIFNIKKDENGKYYTVYSSGHGKIID